MKVIIAIFSHCFFLSFLLKYLDADGVISFDETKYSCCLDEYHCCPEGTSCDIENKKCTLLMPLVSINPDSLESGELFYLKPVDINNLFNKEKLGKHCSNSKFKCPGSKTCCSMEGGKFGCCTHLKGVCCSDLKTCCPHDTVCDVKLNSCKSALSSLLPLIAYNIIEEQPKKVNNTCPDNKMFCQPFETCCSVGYNSYGCCPFANGTCCADRASCCPSKKKCDLKKKRCVHEKELIFHVEKPKSLISYLSDISLETACPDQSKCSLNETCCPIKAGSYGCCPYASGVCCSDMQTCCIQGYKCVENGCTKNVH